METVVYCIVLSAFIAQRCVPSCYLPEFRKSELSSPHFSFATETVGTDQLQPINNKNQVSKVSALFLIMACQDSHSRFTTYSLISFSLSKGLLGVTEVLESRKGRTERVSGVVHDGNRKRVPDCLKIDSLTVRVLNGHIEELIFVGLQISILILNNTTSAARSLIQSNIFSSLILQSLLNYFAKESQHLSQTILIKTLQNHQSN